jgi:hypothetical protein
LKPRHAVLLAVMLSPHVAHATPISRYTHSIIMQIADNLNVPRSIADRLQIEESGDVDTGGWGDAERVSHRGADGARSRGLYMIHPKWQAYLVEHYYPAPAKFFVWSNPIDSALVGLGYLAALHKRFGTWERALWFYNLGRVTKVPRETREYAKRIINWTIPGDISYTKQGCK